MATKTKRPRKFRKGRRLLTVTRAVRAILEDRWLYYRHKPYHPGWMLGWSVGVIRVMVRSGELRFAIPTTAKDLYGPDVS